MKDRESNIYIYIYIFFLILQSAQVLVPYSHGDALYYHLVGPKLWAASSWNSMWEDLSHYAQAGYFDLLYFIPFIFIKSLLLNQIICQSIHYFFSLFLASIFSVYLIKDRFWGPICGVAILTIANDSSFFFYAKNDGALAFFCLIASYLIVEKIKTTSPLFLGAVIGIIPGIKLSGLIVVFPIVMLLFYELFLRKISVKYFFTVGMVSTVVFVPQLLKNYIYTGNPLFPGFISVFPGNLSPPMIDYYNRHFGEGFDFQNVPLQVLDFLTGKSIIFIAFILVFFKDSEYKKYFFISISIFTLYVIFNGNLRFPRFYFSAYFILIIFIFLNLRKIKSNKMLIFVFILVIADSKIDLSLKSAYFAIKDYYYLSEKEIIEKYIPLTRIWSHLETEDSVTYIISDDLSNSYYLPDKIRLHSAHQNLGADFLLNCDSKDYHKYEKYKYALIDKNNINKNICYQSILEKSMLLYAFDRYNLYIKNGK